MRRLIDSVDQRTNLVEENRLELLLCRLGGSQVLAINMFKVKEVIKLPRLTPMPQSQDMDGYRLTSEIRADPTLRHLHVVLHTSLSGHFNQAMVEKVGCDQFLSKFAPSELADLVLASLQIFLEAEG